MIGRNEWKGRKKKRRTKKRNKRIKGEAIISFETDRKGGDRIEVVDGVL